MSGRVAACVGLTLLTISGPAVGQYSAPMPLYPGGTPKTYEQQELPPPRQGPDVGARPQVMPTAPSATMTPPPPPAREVAAPPAAERVFCNQPVSVHVTDPASVPERYRPFIGMWSDASWTPQICAALVVENVASDGTATIVYAFGPMGSNHGTGGVLHGTGIVQNGELRFQNSDGSQYAFKPLFADLDGHLTTPKGQSYGAVFKRAP